MNTALVAASKVQSPKAQSGKVAPAAAAPSEQMTPPRRSSNALGRRGSRSSGTDASLALALSKNTGKIVSAAYSLCALSTAVIVPLMIVALLETEDEEKQIEKLALPNILAR